MPESRLERTRHAYEDPYNPVLPPNAYRVWTDAQGRTHRELDVLATQARHRDALLRSLLGLSPQVYWTDVRT